MNIRSPMAPLAPTLTPAAPPALPPMPPPAPPLTPVAPPAPLLTLVPSSALTATRVVIRRTRERFKMVDGNKLSFN